MGTDCLITLSRVGTTIEDRLILGDVSVLEDMYSRSGALLHAIAGVLDPDNKDRITAAVFSDAWGNRRDFDPSRGSVRAWLVRQARLSYPMGPESDRRVDELVVAATVADMDEVQRKILIEGSAASGRTEDLAEHLDLPVGTVESHLRRGIRTLQAALVDSRLDDDDSRLAAIIRSGRLESDLVDPPSEVWLEIVDQTGADETTPMDSSDLDAQSDFGLSDSDDAQMDAIAQVGDLDDSGEIDNRGYETEDEAASGPALGLVDEFSATDFPGRKPLQPEVPSVGAKDSEAATGFEPDGAFAVDHGDGESDEFPAWAELDSEDAAVEGAGEEWDDAEDLGGGVVDQDGSLGNDEVDDDGVPYVLSGRYRPGVDEDPYAEDSATGGQADDDADITISGFDGTDSADADREVGDRLAAAEATYFGGTSDASEQDLDSQSRPWARILIVAVAIALLVAIVLTLG